MREGGQERKRPERHERGLHDALATKSIGQPSAGEQEASERQRVRVNDPLQGRVRRVEITRQHRQGDVHNRVVDDDDYHHQAENR